LELQYFIFDSRLEAIKACRYLRSGRACMLHHASESRYKVSIKEEGE
jgi:hypothetical protein